MPRYTRARFVCSCGREYSRDSFGVHKSENPGHHEVDRYTYRRKGCGIEQQQLGGAPHRCVRERGHEGAHNCACGDWWGHKEKVYVGGKRQHV